MSNYIFLTDNNSEEHSRYFALSKERIETLDLYETYDQYGQEVGHYNAGDYSINNSYCDAENDCLKTLLEKFKITSKENDFNSPDEIDFLEIRNEEICNNSHIDDSEIENYNEEEINKFIAKWEKENATYTKVEGFTYWDGSNFKTVITSTDFGEPSHNVVDEELTKELNEAIEEKSFEAKGFGCEVFVGGEYVIIDSQWQGTWASYELIAASDYEYLQQHGSSLPMIIF